MAAPTQAPVKQPPRRPDEGLSTAHKPYIPDDAKMPEFTWSAVIVGAILGIIFGASSLYLVLRVGLTVSASVPIAVLSITLFRLFSRMLNTRRATILENNMVQTVGSAGESIAFGVGVTMPALMILGYEMELARVLVVASLGGLLGVLMMIPLRRAFIVRQHGILPYPEGTACADVLIAGEKGGATAKTVFVGFGIALLYKFLMSGMRLWRDIPTLSLDKFLKGATVAGEVTPELLGVGYIIGTKIACVMAAGGVLAAWVLTPLIKMFGDPVNEIIFPGEKLISEMTPQDVGQTYVLYIGAGAVAAGGIISMVQAMPMIIGSLRSGLADLGSAKPGGKVSKRRTENDLSLRVVIVGSLFLVAAIAAAPMLGLGFSLRGLIGAALIVLFGFLFVTVSSRLTGQIGSSSNPISGMTVATLLLTCLVFLLMNELDPDGQWIGKPARLTALSIAAIVCIAASNGGTTSQDLKTGYLVGATPRYQQLGLLVGALSSALVIGATLLVLNDAGTVYARRDYPQVIAPVSELQQREQASAPETDGDTNYYLAWHVDGRTVSYRDFQGMTQWVPQGKYLVDETGRIRYLVDPGINGAIKTKVVDGQEQKVTKYDAPKARLMSLIIDGILTQQLPWGFVLLGVAIAIVLELCGVPSLPFAVGVYLPLYVSAPIFVGGMVRWAVDKLAKKTAAESEMSPGILLSSGYIAGGAIGGILIAMVVMAPKVADVLNLGAKAPQWMQENWVPLAPFGVLVFILILVGTEKFLRSKADSPPGKPTSGTE